MKSFRRVLVVPLIALAACGGDDESSAESATADATADATTGTSAPAAQPTDPAPTDPAPTDAPATDAPATDPPATTVAATDAPATTDTAAAGATIEIGLKEWEVIAPTTMTAGAVSFNVTNTGEFPHQLTIFTGDAYETLPLHPTGAVDIAQLPPLAFTDKIDPGASATLAADLPAGTYVFLCNIEGGGGSHAARGQHLVVTVA